MIGNDVVDLAHSRVESDWRRPGFLEKLFVSSEIELISSSADPEISVWKLWSCKEAAYKIFNRKTGIRTFNPLFFVCADLAPESKVAFGSDTVVSATEITSDYIHTICVENPDWFELASEVPKSAITKIGDLPFVLRNGIRIPATVSHHGSFEKCLALVGDGFDLDLSFQRAVHRTFPGDLE